MKRKKTYIILGVLLTLVIILSIGKNAGWFGEEDTVYVEIEAAKHRKITEIVTANGKIQPEIEIKITPDVSGEIVELPIKEGDKVQKGDLLAKIEPTIYAAMVERMEASLNGAKANLANAKARLTQAQAKFFNDSLSFDRKTELWEEELISQEEYDGAEALFKTSKADVLAASQNVMASMYNVKSTEASLKESKDNLKKTNVFAPVSGTISALMVEQGERIVGTSQFAGTIIMHIADLSRMEVHVDVNENDIIRVKHNDTAKIEVDAYLDRKFNGIITEIANSAQTEGIGTDQVTNFSVKIRILPESYADLQAKLPAHLSPFRPGMSATVDIQTKIEPNALSVPIQAVTTREDTISDKFQHYKKLKESDIETKSENTDKEPFECVFVLNNNKVFIKKVKTGIQDQDYIQIISGLKEGDKVVTGPYNAISNKLHHNMEVQIKTNNKNNE